ncbi:MAG: hypothetical protein JSV86_09685 [Gemmatimonadota bacterium]|nr:MAG: hypothetical protein JSV86_09685 [Gemmatimonadota bacterium]
MKAKPVAVLVLKLVLLTILMFVCIALAAVIVGAGGDSESGEEAGQILLPLLAMCVVNVVVLAYPVVRSRWFGLKLTATVFLVFFGAQTFQGQIETMFFGEAFEISGSQIAEVFLMGALTALFYSPLAVLVLGRMKRCDEPMVLEHLLAARGRGLAWRLAALPLIYLALYFLFGYFVAWQFADVRAFYSGSAEIRPFFAHLAGLIDEDPWIFPWQLLRGLLWVGLAVPVILMMKGKRWEASLALGLLFGLLLTTPLIIPNPLMPAPVRLAHFLETSTSTFAYGWLIGWLLRAPDVGDQVAIR